MTALATPATRLELGSEYAAVDVLTLRRSAATLEAAMRVGTWKETPLGREVDRFLLYLRAGRDARPRTVRDYAYVLGRWATFQAHRELFEFEGAAGVELVLEFVDEHYRDAQPGTRRKVLAIFSSFFRWAVRTDRIAANPMERIDRPRRRRTRRATLDPATVQALIDAQPSLRDRVALSLLARLGLRKNELRMLRWRDIDLRRGELRIHGKGGRVDELPLLEDLVADLARLALEADAKPEHYLLFPTRVGNVRRRADLRGVVREHRDRPMSESAVHRWFKRCLAAAGVADFNMHALRRFAGNEIRRATGDLELTRVFMRHASIATTAEHYMHADRDELERAMRLASERWRKSVTS